MTQENIDKIEKLEKSINSPATPENIKETMRKALELLKSGNQNDEKEIDSVIMSLISYKLNPNNYNESEYNKLYAKLLSFGQEKVNKHIEDFIKKNQNDVSLFEGQNKIEAQEFINRLFELKAESRYDFGNKKTPIKTYSTIKSCLLDDGDDSDDYIYEGKLIHNVEVLPKDTWEIVEFYKYGAVLKHVPTSVLADSKPNKNVSLEELKSLFASDKIEIDGIEKGNTKLFNICIKAIIKCIDSIDMAAYKENLLAELNASKSELEKTIEASNLLESEKSAILAEKSNLEKETSEKIQSLESDIAAKSISMEEATRLKEEETAKLKKQLEDLEALSAMRTLIDMLGEDIAKKDFKETSPIEPTGKIKVKEIRLFSAEGKTSGYGFPKVVSTYEEANEAVMPVYEDAIESSYANKCRFTVTFEDGETYDGDLFVGEKYDNPTKGNVIGKHIKDYLEREIKENRQSEETKKEIVEFLEKYDLGFDNHVTNVDYSSSSNFSDYVNDFYGKNGIYASDFYNNGFTIDEIKEAINRYKKDISEINSDEFSWGGGDSTDRERVRGYLEEMLVNEKYREGDFVFADIFKDKNKKVPFMVSHYSNGIYYILGDGSHYVSETRLSPATEKDFDDYYGESAKSFKKFENGGEVENKYYDSIMQEYKELTSINNHDEAAILLVKNFGTVEELNKLKTIQKANEKRGYSIDSDRKEMDAISNKYYYSLKKITDIPTVSMSRVKSDFVKEPQIFQGNVVSIGENKFKIEDGILYIKKLNGDWDKFRRINY